MNVEGLRYALNCVPTKSLCDGIQKWGLWEVTRLRSGWGTSGWDQVPYKETPESVPPLSFRPHIQKKRLQEDTAGTWQSRKRALTRHRCCWNLDLGFPVSVTMRNKFLLWKLLVCGICYSSPSRTGWPTSGQPGVSYCYHFRLDLSVLLN